MTTHPEKPLRVLFLCTANSARSQIAEALLAKKARGRFEVESAGTLPAARINPLAVQVLRELDIDWTERTPKGIDAVANRGWDLIITVCDQAKETCPTFPGQPLFAHWGMPDPAAVEGSEDARYQAFRDTAHYLARRIDLLLALPVEKLERSALELRLNSIGEGEKGEKGEKGERGPDRRGRFAPSR